MSAVVPNARVGISAAPCHNNDTVFRGWPHTCLDILSRLYASHVDLLQRAARGGGASPQPPHGNGCRDHEECGQCSPWRAIVGRGGMGQRATGCSESGGRDSHRAARLHMRVPSITVVCRRPHHGHCNATCGRL